MFRWGVLYYKRQRPLGRSPSKEGLCDRSQIACVSQSFQISLPPPAAVMQRGECMKIPCWPLGKTDIYDLMLNSASASSQLSDPRRLASSGASKSHLPSHQTVHTRCVGATVGQHLAQHPCCDGADMVNRKQESFQRFEIKREVSPLLKEIVMICMCQVAKRWVILSNSQNM